MSLFLYMTSKYWEKMCIIKYCKWIKLRFILEWWGSAPPFSWWTVKQWQLLLSGHEQLASGFCMLWLHRACECSLAGLHCCSRELIICQFINSTISHLDVYISHTLCKALWFFSNVNWNLKAQGCCSLVIHCLKVKLGKTKQTITSKQNQPYTFDWISMH